MLSDSSKTRLSILVKGMVQGVGFRPFLHRMALSLELAGKAGNTADGLYIEIEGALDNVDTFAQRLAKDAPGQSVISNILKNTIPVQNSAGFNIVESTANAGGRTMVPLDMALCPKCRDEMLDPANRRYRYPFINCTDCGPRYTIISSLPYDRPNTAMHSFVMCPDCMDEYKDIENRRYHAQPIACPVCGPQIRLLDSNGVELGRRNQAISLTHEILADGKIVAVKGLGGFHLACNAESQEAVNRLRKLKDRPNKPFALMVKDLKQARLVAEISTAEACALESPQAPIVLCKAIQNSVIAESVSMDSGMVGLMLPYTPLHLLLFSDSINFLVMTSGNLTGSPTIIDENEALDQLADIADCFLIHNRPILHRADDSIIRFVEDKAVLMRAGRGYAPVPVNLPVEGSSVLAMGGDLKNSFCLADQSLAVVSPYIGDLENPDVLDEFYENLEHLKTLFNITPNVIARDMHPDYVSSRISEYIMEQSQHVQVQHHHAHALSVLADNQTIEPAIAIILDGTGFGTDGTIWGGEILCVDGLDCQRLGHFAPLPLIGSDKATREPWRMAISALLAAYGDDLEDIMAEIPLFTSIAPEKLRAVIYAARNMNSNIITSSVGRLFDAVGSLLNKCHFSTYEGQAAIEFEAMAASFENSNSFNFEIKHESETEPFQINMIPCIKEIVSELKQHKSPNQIARCFHNTLVEALLKSTLIAREKVDLNTVCLSGGVMQNAIILEKLSEKLEQNGFRVLRHKSISPNDGGICIGQAVAGLLDGLGK